MSQPDPFPCHLFTPDTNADEYTREVLDMCDTCGGARRKPLRYATDDEVTAWIRGDRSFEAVWDDVNPDNLLVVDRGLR